MSDDTTATTYRIAWEHKDCTAEVLASVDVDARTITLSMPDGQQATLDVVTSRAVQMLLNHVTYCVLDPSGPPVLQVEAQGLRGGWHAVARTDPTRA